MLVLMMRTVWAKGPVVLRVAIYRPQGKEEGRAVPGRRRSGGGGLCVLASSQTGHPEYASALFCRSAKREGVFVRAPMPPTPVALSKVWDAAMPAKFDAKAEKWTLTACDGGEFGDARLRSRLQQY